MSQKLIDAARAACTASPGLPIMMSRLFNLNAIVTLLGEGFDVLIAPNYDYTDSGIVDILTDNSKRKGVELLLPLLPKDLQLDLPITIDPKLLKLIQLNRLQYSLVLKKIKNVSDIENYIANTSTPVPVKLDDLLLMEYVKLKSIPYFIVVSKNSDYYSCDQLDGIDDGSLTHLIWLAIKNSDEKTLAGAVELFRSRKLELIGNPEFSDPGHILGCIEVSVKSRYLAIKYLNGMISKYVISYMRLINVDLQLQYCTLLEEQWSKLTHMEIRNEVENIKFLEWLKKQNASLPSIDYILEPLCQNPSEMKKRLLMAIAVADEKSTISEDNLKFLSDSKLPAASELLHCLKIE